MDFRLSGLRLCNYYISTIKRGGAFMREMRRLLEARRLIEEIR